MAPHDFLSIYRDAAEWQTRANLATGMPPARPDISYLTRCRALDATGAAGTRRSWCKAGSQQQKTSTSADDATILPAESSFRLQRRWPEWKQEQPVDKDELPSRQAHLDAAKQNMPSHVGLPSDDALDGVVKRAFEKRDYRETRGVRGNNGMHAGGGASASVMKGEVLARIVDRDVKALVETLAEDEFRYENDDGNDDGSDGRESGERHERPPPPGMGGSSSSLGLAMSDDSDPYAAPWLPDDLQAIRAELMRAAQLASKLLTHA